VGLFLVRLDHRHYHHLFFSENIKFTDMITHDTPTSSNIARLKYDDKQGILDVEFRSGKTYRYSNVPYDIWNAFISAPSAGKFFNSTIKGVYKESQV
jgi:hypothetical protein